MKKYYIHKPKEAAFDDEIIGASCYGYEALIIALMTAFTDDLKVSVDAAKWAVEHNVGDKYTKLSPHGVQFEIEICKIEL